MVKKIHGEYQEQGNAQHCLLGTSNVWGQSAVQQVEAAACDGGITRLMPSFSTFNAVGKALEDGPTTWSTAIHVADLDGVAGSWLSPSSDLVIAAMHGGLGGDH